MIEAMDRLKEKVDSKFTLVMEVSKRARDLVKGYRPLTEDPTTNPVTTAIKEVNEGRVHFRRVKE